MNRNQLYQLWENIRDLQKISKRLHRAFENDCNFGSTPRRKKTQERLEKRAAELALDFGFQVYVQKDPRGCALYLYKLSDLRKAGGKISACYTSIGVAVR